MQKDSRIFVAGGFAEVAADRCTVLVEEAAPLAEYDIGGADTRIAAAEKALSDAATDPARADARQALAVAQALRQALAEKAAH